MPISKRDKEVSLTKVRKTTKVRKAKLIKTIQDSVKDYENIVVLDINDTRGIVPKNLRQYYFKTSRIFCGKLKLMALALGKTREDELENDLHKLGGALKGKCALLLTNDSLQSIIEFFNEYFYEDYLTAGSTATQDLIIPKNCVPLQNPRTFCKQTIYDFIKENNIQTHDEEGLGWVTDEQVLCKSGDILTKDQEYISKIFELKYAQRKIKLLAVWSRNKGFEKLI